MRAVVFAFKTASIKNAEAVAEKQSVAYAKNSTLRFDLRHQVLF